MSTSENLKMRTPEVDVPRAPAPWTLRGNAYIVMLDLPEAMLSEPAFIPDVLRGRLEGRFSMLMLLDYHESNVGPYRELLFIPGRFRVGGRLYWSITKIYVSSQDSVVNGQLNWGIPKDHADFEIMRGADGSERFVASKEGAVFADVSFKSMGLPLPSTAKILPEAMRTLVHHRDGQFFFCAPYGTGRVRYAKMRDAHFDEAFVPDVTRGKVLFAVSFSDFRVTFPIARVEPDGAQGA